MSNLVWTWEKFGEVSVLGFTGAWRAKGAHGAEYSICEHPSKEKRWGLSWSDGPGHVVFTGRGTDLEHFKVMAEENERKEAAMRKDLGRKPTEARRSRRRSYTTGRVYR